MPVKAYEEAYEEQAPISQILDIVCKKIAFIFPFMRPIVESITEDPDQGGYLFDLQIDMRNWDNSRTHLYFRRRFFAENTIESLDIDTSAQVLYEDLCGQILDRIRDIMFDSDNLIMINNERN